MWVTYFENADSDISYYRTYSEFVSQVEVNGEKTYVIDKASFSSDSESFPFKIYRSQNHGLICYCSKDAESIKSTGNEMSNSLGVASAVVPVKFYLKEKDVDSSYSNAGFPILNSSLSLAIKSLAIQLMECGVYVKKFYVNNQQNAFLEIESPSFADLISDIEFSRFFSINFFLSDFCSFGADLKRSSRALQLSVKTLRKLKAAEKKKLSKLPGLTLMEDEIKLENIESNSTISLKILSVVSQISP